MSRDRILNYIGGALQPPASGAWMENLEPATGAAYSEVPDGDARDVERAVEAAEKAFPAWSRTPAADRSRFLVRIADLIDQNREKLARAESVDTGKPLALARRLDGEPGAGHRGRLFGSSRRRRPGRGAGGGSGGEGVSRLVPDPRS